MNDEYKAVYRQADALRHKFRNLVDEPGNPVAQELFAGINQLAEEFEMQKSPRSLEDRAKRLAEEVKHVNSQPTTIMDSRHLNEIREGLEDIRDHVRKLSNY